MKKNIILVIAALIFAISCEDKKKSSKKIYDILVYDYAKTETNCPKHSEIFLLKDTLDLTKGETSLEYVIRAQECAKKSMYFAKGHILFDFNESITQEIIIEKTQLPFVVFHGSQKIQLGVFILQWGKDLFGNSGEQYFHWQSDSVLEEGVLSLKEITLQVDLSQLTKYWQAPEFKKNRLTSFIKIAEEESTSQVIKIIK